MTAESRLNRLEEVLLEHGQQLAEITGTQKAMDTRIASIQTAIEKLASTPKEGTSLIQKGIIGAIFVQLLLNGAATPEMAKNLIAQLFNPGGH